MFRLDVIGLDTRNSLLAELLPADFRGHNLIILKARAFAGVARALPRDVPSGRDDATAAFIGLC